MLDIYLQIEGNIPLNSEKYRTFTQFNYKDCLKSSKINQVEDAVLQEMRENLKKIPQPDGTSQFSIKYVVNSPLSDPFPNSSSNYNYALKQAKYNYSRNLSQPGGQAAVDELVARGVRERVTLNY